MPRLHIGDRMKAQVQIDVQCECGARIVTTFEHGDAAEKVVHCGKCGKWQTVKFCGGTKENERTDSDSKPKQSGSAAPRRSIAANNPTRKSN